MLEDKSRFDHEVANYHPGDQIQVVDQRFPLTRFPPHLQSDDHLVLTYYVENYNVSGK
jgi:hypothetical protein